MSAYLFTYFFFSSRTQSAVTSCSIITHDILNVHSDSHQCYGTSLTVAPYWKGGRSDVGRGEITEKVRAGEQHVNKCNVFLTRFYTVADSPSYYYHSLFLFSYVLPQ